MIKNNTKYIVIRIRRKGAPKASDAHGQILSVESGSTGPDPGKAESAKGAPRYIYICIYIYIYIYMCIYIYIYIYIYPRSTRATILGFEPLASNYTWRERERENIRIIYIYIYTYREREIYVYIYTHASSPIGLISNGDRFSLGSILTTFLPNDLPNQK